MGLEILERVLERAAAAGAQGVVAFDLDSTLFDNRPRQARIVREFGYAQGLGELTRCRPEHFASGWDLEGALVACGLSPERAAAHLEHARAYWKERFFTSDYCIDDVPARGAKAYLGRLVSTRAQVAYVTGRHEPMRWGTVFALARGDLPVPGGSVRLIMKPTFELSDDAWKLEAHAQLERAGRVLAAFDNEPTHANDYRRRFPEAIVVLLDTDHSGRPVAVEPGIVPVPDFGA